MLRHDHFSADRYGRKPILSVTVLGYTVFTLLTAMSSGVLSFTLFQSAAQVFLAAEFGVSRERVRQIEVRAFEKVQKAVKNRVAAMETPPAHAAAASMAAH